MVAAVEAPPAWVAPPRAGVGRLRKVAFLGSHAASLAYAPWDDPSWELWAHSSSRGLYHRTPDRYFDLHRKECWSKTNNKGQKYLRWLEINAVPILMQERFPDVPASVRFPIERVEAEFRPYFTNHVAYMTALALVEGVTHLGYFGVNYGFDPTVAKKTHNADVEYGTQRGSAEYWMGVAEGRGVQLVIPKGCTLLRDPIERYGYESHDADGVLVEAYRRRTWVKPEFQKMPTAAVDAQGLAVPPAHLVDLMASERRLSPPPVGALGPIPRELVAV